MPGLALRRPPLPGAVPVALVCLAAAVGALSTVNLAYGVALVAAAGLTLLVAADIHALPVLLVFTMFTESLALGPGLRVGRLAGAFAIAALLYYVLARGHVDLRGNALLAVSGAFGVWMLASVLWADDSAFVYSYLFSYVLAVAYLVSFAMLVRTASHLRAIFVTLALSSLAFGAIAFVTYARNPPDPGSDARAQGLTSDPNYFAVYQVAALPAALVLASVARRPLARLGYWSVVVVIVLSVASSLSRSGLLALVGVVLATVLLPARRLFARGGQKLAYVGLMVAAGVGAVVLGSAAFVERAQSILDPGQSGDRGAGRTDLWRAAWHGYSEHWQLGLGAGNFRFHALDLLQSTPGVDTTRNYILQARAAHNAYLEILTDLGPVGLALFLGVLFLSARYLLLSARRARRAGSVELERFSIAVLLSLGGYAISAVFLSNQLGKLIWTLVGLALALDVITRRLPMPVVVVPEAGTGGPEPYDLDVRERLVEQRERRVAEEFDVLRAERARLAGLEERLRERLRSLEVAPEPEPEPETAAPPAVAEPGVSPELLEQRARLVLERELAVAREHARLAQLARELEARERTLAEREVAPPVALEAVPEPPAPEPEPVPEPPREPEPEPEMEPEPAPPTPLPVPPAVPPAEPPVEPPPAAAADLTLLELEHLVDLHGAGFPELVDEWRYYLLYLRDYADYDGRLPAQFESLVHDVFAPLLGS